MAENPHASCCSRESVNQNGCIIMDMLRAVLSVCSALLRSCLQTVISPFWFLPGRRKSITNDIILITGGGKGIGRIVAVEFARHKPKRIIIWGRHQETLSATASVITMMGVPCDYMVCDVSVREQVEEKAEVLIKKYGGVTILVNNAGVVSGNTILQSDPEEIRSTIETNTVANFWTTRAFLPGMLSQDHGHVVFINSMLGLMGLNGAADYSCSKYANVGLAESLKLEIVKENKHNVHVTSIHPYHIDTDMFAGCQTRFPRLFPSLDPEYVAWKIVDSVLANYNVVLIPRMMYLLQLVNSFLPVDAIIAVHRFTGVDKTMDNFHGRKMK